METHRLLCVIIVVLSPLASTGERINGTKGHLLIGWFGWQLSSCQCDVLRNVNLNNTSLRSILLSVLSITNMLVNFYGLTSVSLLKAAQDTSKPFKPECRGLHKVVRKLLRGEQFYFMPDEMGENLSNDEVKWYRHRNDSVIEPITPDQNQDVHYQGGALFFMNVTLEDSGTYTAV